MMMFFGKIATLFSTAFQVTYVLSLFVSFCFFHQVITLEGWVDIMYYVMDAHSFYNFIYFILLIIVSTTLCLFFIELTFSDILVFCPEIAEKNL